MPERTVLTIGNFDGVHLGHRALVERARAIADEGSAPGRVVAIAFHPHPVTVLAPKRATPPLSTFAQRSAWLREAGADEVIRLEPTPGLLKLTPEQFVDRLVTDYRPGAIVEGEDFRFGHRRAGNIGTLRELGQKRRFDVHVIEPVTVALTDQTIVTASSTITRWLLTNGRVGDVARVLGRWYELSGTVVRGDQRGRDLGFPTANMRIDTLAPGDGVYAAHAIMPGGRVFPAAVHVGQAATFDKSERTVEAHIIGWGGPLNEGTPEYGWPLVLHMVSWLRGQVRFDSPGDLVDQMGRDVARAVEMARRDGPSGTACRTLQEADA
jgi:riboflavin kinase/FMN adenylyltransferase